MLNFVDSVHCPRCGQANHTSHERNQMIRCSCGRKFIVTCGDNGLIEMVFDPKEK